MGAAALLLTFVETWDAALGAAVLFGVGFGAYLAVDQALITQVLPAAADRAKDLGIINIAIVCPAAIGALIAAPLVSLGGYPTLFAAPPWWRCRLRPCLEDQERALTAPRPTRAIWRLCATSWPAASQTSASSSNQPPLTCRHRAATLSGPGTGTPRIYQVSSTVGAQPEAPRPKTTGGSPSTASASR